MAPLQRAEGLSGFYHKLIDQLQGYCHTVSCNNTLTTLQPPREPLTTLKEACTMLLSTPDEKPVTDIDSDTWAIPTLHLHPIGLHHDQHITQALLESCSREHRLHLATAYLNPTPSWWDTLTSWPGR